MDQENGGCGFFEWCDNLSATPTSSYSSRVQESASNTSVADLPCLCGVGSCLVLTAKTGQNVGRQFYRCPNQGSPCGFFKWCIQQNLAVGHRTSYFDNANNKSYSAASGQSPVRSSFNVGRNSASAAASYTYNQTSNLDPAKTSVDQVILVLMWTASATITDLITEGLAAGQSLSLRNFI
ncbi:hypothetical protein C5167_038366 [Papaver somniferum]|uniref:GRF-type domain-containing protein n=1 Tax=Papaver somniferum TaxID=3469 RepID=A0A4Y7IDE9_PAPSO|nr:DNA topoisomerase 3-alpha-like [Papaver somniferum]RZC45419.1 hypothetical protein C5167_038366 [Papaver somniferum]